MARYDFSSPRLFIDRPLAAGDTVPLDRMQANYLVNVLRLKTAASVLIFNGQDGEFLARLSGEGKRAVLVAEDQRRPQTPPPTLRWLFAPIKHARLDYMVQKAVELGVGSIEPVITRRTQVSRLNHDRMHANVIEAAEQCGVIGLPEVRAERPFQAVLDGWDQKARLVFCDEDAPLADPVATLAALPSGPDAVLIGPEGGFDEAERAALLALPNVVRLALGPRILRADTAAVAALTLVQAVRGDWRG